MSVRLKRAAKALRARFGVAAGVQEAKPGDTCQVKVLKAFKSSKSGIPILEEVYCGEPAHVVGMCLTHMKAANKPRRR